MSLNCLPGNGEIVHDMLHIFCGRIRMVPLSAGHWEWMQRWYGVDSLCSREVLWSVALRCKGLWGLKHFAWKIHISALEGCITTCPSPS